jgi:hypothetical protein
MKQVETKNELAVRFREQLQRWCKVEHIGVLYAQLFSLKTDDELQQELEYLYTLYKGTDDYFKADSIDCWFTIWHKSIRQCDYFTNCYKANSIDLVTDDERKEFKFLANKCRAKDFSKTEGKEDNQLFNETYKRYLHLHDIIRRERKEDSITGKLDSMLWNLVHVDKGCELRELFVITFKVYSDCTGFI